MRRWRLIGAWLAVLLVTTTLTWQIVSAADDRVGDRSGAPLNIAAPSFDTSSVTTGPPPQPGVTTTGGSSSSSSGTTPTGSTPTSTSAPSATSSPSAPETVVIPTVGGTVTVRVVPGSVTYVSSVPNPGFAVEVDDAGPPEVRVELVSSSTEVEVRARWRDGTLEVRVDVD